MLDDLLSKQRAYKAKQLLGDLLASWERTQKDANKLSAARAILAASKGRYRQEAGAEYEAWGCVDHNQQRFVIPFDAYLGPAAMRGRRDLMVAQAAAGGFMTSAETGPLALPLVAAGVVQAGATIVTNVSANQLVPMISAKPTFTWVASENASLPVDATMALGRTTASMKRGGISLKASRQLTLQEQNFSSMVDRLLIQLGNDAIDAAVLSGSGVSGQPLGLLDNASVVAVTGVSMNLSGLATMEENAVQNDATDSGLTWFASTDTRRILRQRELSVGGGTIWPGSTLLGHPAIVTSKMPAASLLVGDFSNLDVLLFGNGVEVLVDPFSNFQSGNITFQLAVACESILNYPASFRKSTTIN